MAQQIKWLEDIVEIDVTIVQRVRVQLETATATNALQSQPYYSERLHDILLRSALLMG